MSKVPLGNNRTITGIPNHLIEELLGKIRLSSVFEQLYGVQPIIIGAEQYALPCVFHEETKASLRINDTLGYYHCFGCHASGNAITLVYHHIGEKNYLKAVQILSKMYDEGIYRQIVSHIKDKNSLINPNDYKKVVGAVRKKPVSINAPVEPIDVNRREEIYREIMEVAKKFIGSKSIPESDTAKKYLISRGIDKLVENFSVGFLPKGDMLKMIKIVDKDVHPDELVKSGLISEKHQNNFSGRIIFPLVEDNHVKGIAGRALDPKNEIRYLYNKGFEKKNYLYMNGTIRNYINTNCSVLLTEGLFDMLTLHASGMKNATTTLGALLTQEQFEKIKDIQKIHFIYDGDRAGFLGSVKAIEENVGKGNLFFVVPMEKGKDINDVFKGKSFSEVKNYIYDKRILISTKMDKSVNINSLNKLEEYGMSLGIDYSKDKEISDILTSLNEKVIKGISAEKPADIPQKKNTLKM